MPTPRPFEAFRVKNIFVGNLGSGDSDESVRALFESHGTVNRVHVVTDRDTGQTLGFGFVEMPNERERQEAIAAVDATRLLGRTLHVNQARPRDDRWGETKLNGIALSVCGPIMRVAIRGCDDAAQFVFRGGQWFAEDGLPAKITFLSPFSDDGLDTLLDASLSPSKIAEMVD